MPQPRPLDSTEKAYFDTIKQVVRSARPEHLSLRRMRLDGRDVAVIGQLVLDRSSGRVAGWMPLAIVITDEQAEALVDPSGARPETVDPNELEGPA